MERPIDYDQIYTDLRNPLADNKPLLLAKVREMEQEKEGIPAAPYFCSNCHFTHRSGRIHQEHANYRENHFIFPPIIPLNPRKTFKTRIVGINQLQTQDHLTQIAPDTPLRVRFLKSGEFMVFRGKRRLGYLPRTLSPEITGELTNPTNTIQCIFLYYQPFREHIREKAGMKICAVCRHYSRRRIRVELDDGYSDEHAYVHCIYGWKCEYGGNHLDSRFFTAPYGAVKITITDTHLFQRIATGLLDWHALGYPNVDDGTLYFTCHELMQFEQMAIQRGYLDLSIKIFHRGRTIFPTEQTFSIIL